MTRAVPVVALLWIVMPTPARPQTSRGPFTAPPQYERDREFHTAHVLIRLKLDWATRSFGGSVVHTVIPLRDGLSQLHFDAGRGLRVLTCSAGGKAAHFSHPGDVLAVDCPRSLPRGHQVEIRIAYRSAPAAGRSGSGLATGYHWVVPDRFDPARKPGFWTYGWPTSTHNWVPVYDYPNDRVTSDVYVAAPRTWFVLGNGRLAEVHDGGSTRTFHWRMERSHPTYLFSLAAGEMEVVRDRVDGTELIFDVPRGEGPLIRPSFARTADMVRFYSRLLGVKYPWPKYGQSALFDFGGGMENVSATSLQETSLTDPRGGTDAVDSLVSHELAHQWFGDLVTYRDWSQTWLSEGFATFLQMLYFEHARGRDAYDRERENALQAYLMESRRYRRPIVTRNYPAPWAMLDSHSYPKAALVLHLLRRRLGDAVFFRALGHFLRKHACGVVDTNDLERAIAESTGTNVEAFIDQWIYHPGHPVVEFDWAYDDPGRQVVLNVRQVQETSDGTPIYRLDMPVGILCGSRFARSTVTLNSAAAQFRIACASKPDSVLLDPDHDLLMERRARTWPPGEAESVMRDAPCSLDRQDAALSLLKPEASDSQTESVLESALRDPSTALRVRVLGAAGDLRRGCLRERFRAALHGGNPEVRAAAMHALSGLPATPTETESARMLINDREPYVVVTAALAALAAWDPDGNMGTFRSALTLESRHEVIRAAAIEALGKAKGDPALALVAAWAGPSHPRFVRLAAVSALAMHKDRLVAVHNLESLAKEEDPQIRARALAVRAQPAGSGG